MNADELATALECAARGWPVFPCKADKRPLTEHGFEDATTDEIIIKAWWVKWPHAMVGIATGKAGLVVIDVDVKRNAPGRRNWASLVGELGRDLLATAVTRTQSGGWHYYYAANGHHIPNSASKLGEAIDVRGEGGYVIAYEWLPGHGPETLQKLPKSLVERLAAARKERAPAVGDEIPAGRRNPELASIAGTMRRRGLGEAEIAAALLEVNARRCTPPLDTEEVRAIARSVGGYRPATDGEEAEPLVHEAAHAEVLASAWHGHYRWAQHEGTWRRWTGKVWQAVAEPAVVSAAQLELRRHYGLALAERQSKDEDKRLRTLHGEVCKFASVLGGLAFLKGMDGFFTEVGRWDADPYLLNCADGILDLRSQQLRPHDPEALCTKITRWNYNKKRSSGAWQRHLERCLPEAEVRRQVQRDLGRALVGADLEESLPIWYGKGANGKSTTEHAIQRGLDGYAKKAVRNLLVASKFDRHPTEIADLAGSRLVFSEEVEDGKALAEALVKDLTGGAVQKARFMRQDNFEFEQTFTIFLLVNHRPTISGTDNGIWRRIRLVPWTVAIPLAEQRPQDEVVAELVADGAWALRWMVAGLADWQADHHWVAAEVQAATADYQAEQDRLTGFIADTCEEKPFAQVAAAELYNAYLEWCKTEDELALSKTAFGKALKNKFTPKKGMHGGGRVWVGIRLRVARGGAFSGSSHEKPSRENEAEVAPPGATPDASTRN